jgi:hypothetical protein
MLISGVLLGLLNILVVFSTEDTPALSPYGTGWVESLNNPLIRKNNVSTHTILENGMGMFETCSHCIEEHYSNGFVVLPISTKLVEGVDTVEENYLQTTEDILVLTTTCTSVPFTGSNLNSNSSRFEVKSLRYTNSDSTVDLEFSFWRRQTMVTYFCSTQVKDRKGKVVFRYKKGSGNAFWPAGLFEVYSEQSNCVTYGHLCLASADRIGISRNLIGSSFQIGSYTVNDVLVPVKIKSGLVDNSQIADYIQGLVGYVLRLSRANFETNYEVVSIQTNTIAIATRLNFGFFTAYLAVLSAYAAYIIGLLSYKLFLLRNVSPKEMSYLKDTLHEGSLRYQSLYLLTYQLNSGVVNANTPVQFGEDKKTIGQECGLLRFGVPDDIAPVQPERTYLHFK